MMRISEFQGEVSTTEFRYRAGNCIHHEEKGLSFLAIGSLSNVFLRGLSFRITAPDGSLSRLDFAESRRADFEAKKIKAMDIFGKT
jgi:hypothetical protein